jgi:hypothetical protein
VPSKSARFFRDMLLRESIASGASNVKEGDNPVLTDS